MKIWNHFLAILASYYSAVLLHEWGHGLVAWIYGYKKAFFDVDYGGIFFQHVDEAVPYDQILQSGHGRAAALIGIAGVMTSLILFLISCWVLARAKYHKKLYCFFYWFAVINLVPVIQYLAIQPFSLEGDTGRFVQGLGISPFWVWIPGVVFVIGALTHFLRAIAPKTYRVTATHTLWGQRSLLLVSLCLMFLLIYFQGYNPLSDRAMPLGGKILAIASMGLVPILFFICNPSRKWVQEAMNQKISL